MPRAVGYNRFIIGGEFVAIKQTSDCSSSYEALKKALKRTKKVINGKIQTPTKTS